MAATIGAQAARDSLVTGMDMLGDDVLYMLLGEWVVGTSGDTATDELENIRQVCRRWSLLFPANGKLSRLPPRRYWWRSVVDHSPEWFRMRRQWRVPGVKGNVYRQTVPTYRIEERVDSVVRLCVGGFDIAADNVPGARRINQTATEVASGKWESRAVYPEGFQIGAYLSQLGHAGEEEIALALGEELDLPVVAYHPRLDVPAVVHGGLMFYMRRAAANPPWTIQVGDGPVERIPEPSVLTATPDIIVKPGAGWEGAFIVEVKTRSPYTVGAKPTAAHIRQLHAQLAASGRIRAGFVLRYQPASGQVVCRFTTLC